MSCNSCSTRFCYLCGKRYRHTIIGGHENTYSIFGCTEKLHPNNALLRRGIRVGILGKYYCSTSAKYHYTYVSTDSVITDVVV